MVKELEKSLVNFPGEASRTHCFCHIINLVAKSIITQFNALKNQQGNNGLVNLAGPIEAEEERQQIEDLLENKEMDDDEGWVDERAELSGVELAVLDLNILPARCVLTKVGVC